MTEFTTWRSLVDGEKIGAIPDSVVSLYDFGDNSDSSIIVDIQSGFDMSVTGSIYSSSEPQVGVNHGDFDDGEFAETDKTDFDLVSDGETGEFSMFGWGKDWNDSLRNGIFYGENNDNYVSITNRNGDLTIFSEQPSGTAEFSTSHDFDDYAHFYAEFTDSDVTVYIDGEEVGTSSMSTDITDIAESRLVMMTRPAQDESGGEGLLDDVGFANRHLTDDELDNIIGRAD